MIRHIVAVVALLILIWLIGTLIGLGAHSLIIAEPIEQPIPETIARPLYWQDAVPRASQDWIVKYGFSSGGLDNESLLAYGVWQAARVNDAQTRYLITDPASY